MQNKSKEFIADAIADHAETVYHYERFINECKDLTETDIAEATKVINRSKAWIDYYSNLKGE